MDRFHDLSLYRLHHDGEFVKRYQDELTELQRNVLKLLGMTEQAYWQEVR